MKTRITAPILAVASAASACALGIRIADQAPEATARGNAFAATADSPAAIYYNPAGITQLEGAQLKFGVYGVDFTSDYRSPTGSKSETKGQIDAVPQLYATWTPTDLPLSFGLGIYSPYGLSLEWPDDSGFRTIAQKGSITYLTANPVVAWKVTSSLSIAAGLTANYSDAELSRGLFVPGDQFRFKGDDTAVGFNAGVRWQPQDKHAFGVTYRSATTMDYSGHSTLNSLLPFAPSYRTAAEAKFEFPQNVVLGYSFRPTEKWNLEFNADWTDWDALNTVNLNQQGGATVPLTFNWKSSWFYEFGATRQLPKGIAVSAGYIYSENSVPDKSFNPIVPDSDRHIFSVGVKQSVGHWNWALAYQFAYGPWRTVSGSSSPSFIGETADGRYQATSHALSLSIGCAF